MKIFHAFGALVALAVLLANSSAADAGVTAPDFDFSFVRVADTDSTTITLTADATGAQITSFTATSDCGPFSPSFSLALPQTIAADGTLDMDVDFTPVARGALSCTLNFKNAGNVSQGTATILGTGTAPEMTVAPTTLAFGKVRTVDATASKTFAVSNVSLDLGEVLNVTLSVTPASSYSITPAILAIDPGEEATVTVTFNPNATGALNGSVSLMSNDPLTPTASVTLTGEGTTVVIGTTPTLNFGNIIAGDEESATVTISNSGVGAPLTVTSAEISPASWFTFTGGGTGCNGSATCTFSPVLSIAAGSSKSMDLMCAPPIGATGTQTSTVTFVSNSDAGGQNSTTLICKAVHPAMAIDVTSHDFGAVRITEQGTFNIKITNAGSSTLTYDVIKSGTEAASFDVTGCKAGCTVDAGAFVMRAITFNPTIKSDYDAAFQFTPTGVGAPTPIEVSVMGVGVQPEIAKIAPTGTTLAFGDVLVGTQSSPRTITIKNTGNELLTIDSSTVTGGDGYEVVTGGIGMTTVEPLDSKTWTIRCVPTARGNYSRNFTIMSDAAGNSSFSIPLTCKGVRGELTVTPASIAFGQVNVGDISTRTVTVKNVGEVAVNVMAATLQTAGNGYTIDGFTADTLSTNESLTFDVVFEPLNGDDGGANLVTLTTDLDPDNAPTIAISGDGRMIGLDVSTAELDFGKVRWDRTAERTFEIENTGEVTATNIVLAITEPDFSVQGVRVNGTLLPPGPFSLSPLQVAVVTVLTSPNDVMLGALTGNLQMTSSLATNGSATVALKVTSTAAGIVLSPTTTLAFGGVDVSGGGATTLFVTVTNNGIAPLTITDIAITNSAGGVFALAESGPYPFDVESGAIVQRAISYTPTVERSAEAPDVGSLQIDVSGLHVGDMAGPSAVNVVLTGHGTDRHLLVPPPIQFPDTYRNPGDDAPVLSATLTNTGEAPLELSAVMLSGDAAFTLLDDQPVVVEGGETADFRVRFAPGALTANLEAELLVSSDDPDMPDAIVLLRGNGISRQVAVTLAEIDLGVTAVGVPVLLSERVDVGLELRSTAPQAFLVQPLEVANDTDGVFRVIDGSTVRDLPAGEEISYDVEFAPERAGSYSAVLRIYLDSDPNVFVEVPVRGWAVGTAARGGCSAGSDGMGTLGLVMIALLALMGRRRSRRRMAMATTGMLVALVATFALGNSTAYAGNGREIDATTFRPRTTIDERLFEVQPATVGQAGSWALGLTLGHAIRPLQIDVVCGNNCPPSVVDGMTDTPVAAQSLALLGGAIAIADRFELGASVPIWLQSGDTPMFSSQPADGMTLGDIALYAKARLLTKAGISAGAALTVTAPTASSDDFVGGGTASGEIQAQLSWQNPGSRLLVAGNLGGLFRAEQAIGQTRQGSQLTYGAGLAYQANTDLWLAAETFGGFGISDGGPANSPLQALVGLRYRLTPTVGVAVGAGMGLLGAIGVPTARGFLMLSYSPGTRTPVLVGASLAERDPDGDSDGDGVRNADDDCPDQPEDKDMFDDSDGCPDFDNDNDGVPDDVDSCAMQAEDIDGFADDDGCPDLDNDGDSVPDLRDACPLDPEDFDQHDDLDGCPDLDGDHDGVTDDNDKCPDQPETINGVKDDDGCPDAGDSLVLLGNDKIEIFSAVKFARGSAKIESGSFNLLGQIAATLRANPEIKLLTVEVHVLERGRDDQSLSDGRAAAIVSWLAEWGIAADRLRAVGRGSTMPLVDKSNSRAELINERTEFLIRTN